MKSESKLSILLVTAFALCAGILAPAPVHAQFLFPRLAAVRLNAQTRALNNQAARNLAQVNANAAAFGAVAVVPQRVIVQPRVVVASPFVSFASPSFAVVPRNNVVFFGGGGFGGAGAFVGSSFAGASSFQSFNQFGSPFVPLSPLTVSSSFSASTACSGPYCGF